MIRFLEILFLIIPVTAWALWNDRNGDEHKTINDIFWEQFIMVSCSIIVRFIEFGSPNTLDSSIFFVKCLTVSVTGFGLIFPYAFNWYWYCKNRVFVMTLDEKLKWIMYYVLTHLSGKAWPDRVFLKYNIHWAVRLAMYIVLFGVSVYWFW